MSRLLSWIDRLFNKHKLVRRGLVVWAVVMITLTIHNFFTVSDKISGAGSVFIAILGLLAVVIGLYERDRARDDRRDD